MATRTTDIKTLDKSYLTNDEVLAEYSRLCAYGYARLDAANKTRMNDLYRELLARMGV